MANGEWGNEEGKAKASRWFGLIQPNPTESNLIQPNPTKSDRIRLEPATNQTPNSVRDAVERVPTKMSWPLASH